MGKIGAIYESIIDVVFAFMSNFGGDGKTKPAQTCTMIDRNGFHSKKVEAF